MSESELYQTEEIFKELLENIKSGVAIYETPDNGENFIIREMNKAGLANCKISRKEIKDKNLIDLFPNVGEFGFLDALRRVWKTGKSEVLPRALYKDDRIYGWTEMYLYRLPSKNVVTIFETKTKLIEIEENFRKKVEFEKTISSISSHLINPKNVDDVINFSLKEIGNITKASRSYIFMFDDENNTMTNTYEWCSENASPQLEQIQNIPMEMFKWSINKIKKGELINIENVDTLPPEASAEKEEFLRENIKSLIMVPVKIGEKITGFIGLDNVIKPEKWSEEDLNLLRLSSNIIGSALQREKTENELESLNERLQNIINKRTNELQKIESEKSIILESISEHIVFQDLDNTILWVNKAAADSVDMNPEEMIGLKCYSIWNVREEPCIGCPIVRSLETKKPEINEMNTPDGRYWIVSGYPVKDINGNINAVVEVTREITKEKIAEEKLKGSEEKYRKLFENSPIALMEQDYSKAKVYIDHLKSSGVVDFEKYFDDNPKEVLKLLTKNKVLDLNRKTVELYKANNKEELMEKMNNYLTIENLEKHVTEDVLSYNKKEILAFLKGETIYDSEIASKTFTEDTIYLNARTAILPGFENSWSKVVISLVDFTEQKIAEKKIKESEKRYRKAYYQANLYRDIFAHDINNILQNISSSVELSALYIHNPEKLSTIKELYNIIDEQVNRAKKLILNVRKITEIEESEIKLEKIDINRVLNTAIEFLQSSFQTRNINIQINAFSQKTYIYANDLLLDVFENLLINAVRHNNKSKIDIIIDINKLRIQDKDYIKMDFKDNGIGVSDYRKKIIFERGRRENQRSKGMGLGLSLVKKIIDNYNGRIWVEDRIKGDYNQGSNFVVLIPTSN